jgi:hypothetical protein
MNVSILKKEGISAKKAMLSHLLMKDEGETLTYQTGNSKVVCKWDDDLFTSILAKVPDIEFLTCWCHVDENSIKEYVVDVFVNTKHVRLFACLFLDEIRFATNIRNQDEFSKVESSHLPSILSGLYEYILRKIKIRQLVQPVPVRYMQFTKELKERSGC